MTNAETILRLAEIEAERARLAAESRRLIAALAGAEADAGEAVTPSVNNVHERPEPDAPEPAIDLANLVALKVAAARWQRSHKSVKRLAEDHRALHKVGGRWMVDDIRLRAGIFGQVFPLLDK